MQFIIIIGIFIVVLAVLFLVLEISGKRIKDVIENKRLNELTDKFPENVDICKSILKDLNNEDVKIEEDKETKTSLYLVMSNKIIIANNRDSFTRIQTIAHECIHSIQSKKMLMFNYIYSNMYLLYFAVISILTVFKVVNNLMLQVEILTILGLIYYFIRSMLEFDAMIKAKYVAKDYMEKCNCCTNEEIQEIVEGYDKLNNIGIKGANLELLFNIIIKVIIYCVICIIVV